MNELGQSQMGGEDPQHCNDPVALLLYLLLRDYVHPGGMEQIFLDLERPEGCVPTLLTNKYLAGYAENLATRLRKIGLPQERDDADTEPRTIVIDNHEFRVEGRLMKGSDLYNLPMPPLDPKQRDLYWDHGSIEPAHWVDPDELVDFHQGEEFFSSPRHVLSG